MAKFIFYTDYHLTNKKPCNRKDDFVNTLLSKLEETYNLANENKVDCLLFGGDFFHNHKINDYDLLHKTIQIITKHNIPTYHVHGQHDLIGHNKDSYSGSTLCFLERYSSGLLRTLQEPLVIDNVSIIPCHWYDDLYKVIDSTVYSTKYNILLAHQSITHKKMPFSTILTKEINTKTKPELNLILSGDIHSGHNLHHFESDDINKTIWDKSKSSFKENITYYYNPGSLSRHSIKDKERKPKVALLSIDDNITLKEIYMNVEMDVFNYVEAIDEPDKEEKTQEETNEFFNQIQTIESESSDIRDVINKTAKTENLDSEVIQYLNDVMERV